MFVLIQLGVILVGMVAAMLSAGPSVKPPGDRIFRHRAERAGRMARPSGRRLEEARRQKRACELQGDTKQLPKADY